MHDGLRLGVNTQTPLIRFREGSFQATDPLPLSELVEGEDYKATTGGVTRMLLPLLSRWRRDGRARDIEWVALGADESSPSILHEGIRLSFVGLPPESRAGYAAVKEHLWELLNANPMSPAPRGEQGIAEADWRAFDEYQRLSAQALE